MRRLQRDFRLGKNIIMSFPRLDTTDLTEVRKMRNHPLVRKWMYTAKIISPQEHRSFVSGLKRSENSFYWLVKAKERCLGVIYLNRIDWEHKHAYLGIYANPLSGSAGRGSQLLKCLTYVGFKKAGLKSIKLEVMEDNLKAIRFYRKNGFKMEGRLRAFVRSSGGWKDVYIMGLLRE